MHLHRLFLLPMITIYVIESIAGKIRYTGMAADVQHRLKEHNSGKTDLQKGVCPGRLFIPDSNRIGLQQEHEKSV